MPIRLSIGLLAFLAGVAGNLIAGWLQQGKWAIQPTTEQFLGTLAGAGLILLFVALLESEHALSWNWRWHRFWYLRELLNNDDLRHWEADFARLQMIKGKKKNVRSRSYGRGGTAGHVDCLTSIDLWSLE